MLASITRVRSFSIIATVSRAASSGRQRITQSARLTISRLAEDVLADRFRGIDGVAVPRVFGAELVQTARRRPLD